MLHPLQQRFLNLINQENFAQISQEEAVKQEIVATLEALCGIAEATQIDNVAALFSFLMDFLSSCIGLMEVIKQAESWRSTQIWCTTLITNIFASWWTRPLDFKDMFVNIWVIDFCSCCSGLQQHA